MRRRQNREFLCARMWPYLLPRDLQLKIYKHYKRLYSGTPLVWRLVCREMRDAVADEPKKSVLVGMGASISLVEMARGFADKEACEVKRHGVIHAAVAHGNPRVVEWILHQDWAIKSRWCRQAQCSWQKEWLCQAACLRGHLDVLKLLVANGLQLSSNTCRTALARGHYHIVDWHLFLSEIYEKAYRTDNFDKVSHPISYAHPYLEDVSCSIDIAKQWRPIYDFHDHLMLAAKNGHLALTQRLKKLAEEQDGYSHTGTVTVSAAEGGQLGILEWIMVTDGVVNMDMVDEVMEVACRYGRLNVIKWLYSKYTADIKFDYCMEYCGFDLELVKWLVEDAGMQVDAWYMTCAIEQYNVTQNFEVMDYLYSKGIQKLTQDEDYEYQDEYHCACKMDKDAPLQVVQWLFDRGYQPIGRRAMHEAMLRDDLPLVKKLIEVGFRFEPEWYGSDAMKEYPWRAHNNWDKWKVVRWARENGCLIAKWQPPEDVK